MWGKFGWGPRLLQICYCNKEFNVSDVVNMVQVLMSEFEGWASVQGDKEIAFDWDDAAGNAARREAGLKLEKLRNAEIR